MVSKGPWPWKEGAKLECRAVIEEDWTCKGDPAGRDADMSGRCALMYQTGCLVSEARRCRRTARQVAKDASLAEDGGHDKHRRVQAQLVLKAELLVRWKRVALNLSCSGQTRAKTTIETTSPRLAGRTSGERMVGRQWGDVHDRVHVPGAGRRAWWLRRHRYGGGAA